MVYLYRVIIPLKPKEINSLSADLLLLREKSRILLPCFSFCCFLLTFPPESDIIVNEKSSFLIL